MANIGQYIFNDFVLGGISSSIATVFTNPIEVVKIRMQLQGELGSEKMPYRGIINALKQIYQNDGVVGLQKGLVPSLYFQFILNAFRLGIYTKAHENGWTLDKNGNVSILKCALWGGTGGFVGAALSNPFFMLKTRLQSKTKEVIAVGYQHKHERMIDALKSIYRQHGIQGLYRGVTVNLPRALLGSGGQLAGFGYTKDYLEKNYSAKLNSSEIALISGAVAGTVMTITMNPPDVIATRLYNQGVTEAGKGMYYKGVIDCCMKVIRTEGIMAFYKGFWPHYARVGPHATLVLFFFDRLKYLRDSSRTHETVKLLK